MHITTFSTLEKGLGISVSTSDQCASVIKQATMRAVKNMFENKSMLESIVCLNIEYYEWSCPLTYMTATEL